MGLFYKLMYLFLHSQRKILHLNNIAMATGLSFGETDMIELVNAVNGIVWSPALIALCLGVGLYFSVRSRFLQLRHVREMTRLMREGKSSEEGVSSFQALAMTLAGRVGRTISG